MKQVSIHKIRYDYSPAKCTAGFKRMLTSLEASQYVHKNQTCVLSAPQLHFSIIEKVVKNAIIIKSCALYFFCFCWLGIIGFFKTDLLYFYDYTASCLIGCRCCKKFLSLRFCFIVKMECKHLSVLMQSPRRCSFGKNLKVKRANECYWFHRYL